MPHSSMLYIHDVASVELGPVEPRNATRPGRDPYTVQEVTITLDDGSILAITLFGPASGIRAHWHPSLEPDPFDNPPGFEP